jgi:hypothetical protein
MSGEIEYKETPAKDKVGYLLYSPLRKNYFFRLYHNDTFTDYDLNAEEIEIKILGDWVSLYESDHHNKLDFNSKALGK